MRVRLIALAAALIGCSRAEGPIRLASDDAKVEIEVAPFSMTVLSRDGRRLLTTVPEGLAGGAYGAPAATEDRPTFEGQALAGWDGYRAHELPWTRGVHARLLERTATSARLLLGAGSDAVGMTKCVKLPRVRSIDVPGEVNVYGPNGVVG